MQVRVRPSHLVANSALLTMASGFHPSRSGKCGPSVSAALARALFSCSHDSFLQAFGIMLGTVASLAFYKVRRLPGPPLLSASELTLVFPRQVPDPTNVDITGLNWRLMLGS